MLWPIVWNQNHSYISSFPYGKRQHAEYLLEVPFLFNLNPIWFSQAANKDQKKKKRAVGAKT